MFRKNIVFAGLSAALAAALFMPFLRPSAFKIGLAAETRYAAEIVMQDGAQPYRTFSEALSAWESGGALRLLRAARTETLKISGEKTLDLNGFSLTGDGGGPVIELLPGSALTVRGEGTLTGGKAKRGGGIYAESAKLFLEGGCVCGNEATEGGGIYLSRSEFSMKNGAVVEGNSADYGGGIYLFESEASLSGARVSLNQSIFNGGGFYLWGEDRGARLELSEGAVVEKNAAQGYGGGVAVWTRGSAVIGEDAVLRENRAISGGGGLFLHGKTENTKGAEATVERGAEICRNMTDGTGGGVNVIFGGVLSMTGGEVYGNTAEIGGGIAVSVSGFAKFGGDCLIRDNKTRNGKESGVFSEQEEQIEICAGFSGTLGLSMSRAGTIGKIFTLTAAGLSADEENMELAVRGDDLLYREKRTEESGSGEGEDLSGGAGGGQQNGNAAIGDVNASSREGERAIAIMIVIAAAAAVAFIAAGFIARVFRKKHSDD